MNVIEELIEDRVDRAYVERRVEGWVGTIEALYADIIGWLPEDWRAWEDGNVPMHEELMQRFGLPPRRLPILRLENEEKRGWIEPRGLWIIGANGRVDLMLPPQHFLIVNRRDSFEPPDWQVASILARRDQKPLSRRTLLDVLA